MPNLGMRYDEGPKPITFTLLVHTAAINMTDEEDKKDHNKGKKEEKIISRGLVSLQELGRKL